MGYPLAWAGGHGNRAFRVEVGLCCGAVPAMVPERIGRFEVVAHLATGGMGQVFLARASGPRP